MTEQSTGESINNTRSVLLEKHGSVDIDFNEYLDQSMIPEEHSGLKDFNVVAKIDLGVSDDPENQQTMYIVDTRNLLNTTTDFLLVDAQFDENFAGRGIKHGSPNSTLGYKGIHENEVLSVGRAHNTEKQGDNRFRHLSFVSGNHFQIEYDGQNLRIQNTNPTFDTVVTANMVPENEVSAVVPEFDVTKTDPDLGEKIGGLSLSAAGIDPSLREKLKQDSIGLVHEARGGDVNQDTYLIDAENQVFGVFDGMGGHEGGAEASLVASETVHRIMTESEESSSNDFRVQRALIKKALNEAHVAVMEINKSQGIDSGTTAVIAKVVENEGKKYLVYGSIGDSRLYLRHADETLEQVTKDEGHGNVIYNAIGSKHSFSVSQVDYKEIPEGAQIILMSDGINGDHEKDIPGANIYRDVVTNEEFLQALKGVHDHQEVAQTLRDVSIKYDDKTVVVIGDLLKIHGED